MNNEVPDKRSKSPDKSLLSSDTLQTILTPSLLTSLGAVVAALLVGAVLIAAIGVNPLKAYGTLIDGAFGNRNSVAELLVRAIPLALAGIGVSIAFRAGAFNVGAEGQLYLGAIASTWVGLTFPHLPHTLLITMMILAGMLVGGVYAAIAALLKVWRNASELINTIMMNYIAIFFVGYLVHGPLQEPGSPLGQTARLPDQAHLSVILKGTRLHSGLILAIVVAIIAYIVLWRTRWGFYIRVAGKNQLAAMAAGINVKGTIVSAFVLSGALAGLAGFCEASGVHHRMIENISPGYGYTAIVVALLGQTNPSGVLASAFLFAALQVGASTMESAVGVPSSIVTIVQYLIVIFVIGRGTVDLIRQRLRQPQLSE